jgi:ferredoxin
MIEVDRDRCTGCGTCVEACPTTAIEMQDGFAHILLERCTGCGSCVEVCPQGAVLLLPEPVPAADSRELTVATADGQPAGRPGEVIAVRVPPLPTATPTPQPLARQLVPALGAALSFLGREVAPRLLRLATDLLEERILTPPRPSSRATSPRNASGGAKRRRRQRLRGRR